ncbi:MAG: DUF4126 domain-containing protein [Burkholderiales bacterium]|nr:DUF4126 domain-containing protein [Burkholderiales bacterium]
MDTLEHIALAAGLAWGSGIRVYAVVFLAGALARFGVLELPDTLAVLSHPWVLAASGFMFFVEFFADKVPGFDSAWDAVHTFIRIPAGAFLAAAALGHADPVWVAVAAILGGALASGSHAAKAGGRAAINLSPEPFSNWAASLAEDLVVPAGLVAAVKAPLAFLAALLVFVGLTVWLAPRLWRGVRRILARLRGQPTAP